MHLPSATIWRALLGFASIWVALMAVPGARALVGGQLHLLPGALRRHLWIGLAAGLALVAVDVGLLRQLGRIEIQGVRLSAPWWMALNLVFIAFLAVTEEMVFRGVLYLRLEERLGALAAIAGSAALFSLFHFVGRPFSWDQAVGYFLDGAFLAALVFWTRDLWTAVGWHTAKNLAVSETFGGSYPLKEPLLRLHNLVDPRWARTQALVVDLIAFLVSVALCLALLGLTRRSRYV